MKNIFKFLIVGAMLFVLLSLAVSCSEADKVNSALENTRELDSVSADVYINAYVSHGSLKKRFKVIESISASGDLARVELGEYGSDTTSVVYSDGVYAYFDGNKQALMQYEKYNGSYKAFTHSLLDFKMGASLFEKIESNEAGGKLTVKKTFSEKEELDAFDEIIKPFTSQIEARLSSMVGCDDCKDLSTRCRHCELKNVEYIGESIELLIKDGYVERIRVKFDMSCTLDSLSTVVELDLEVNFNNPGKDVSVTLPANVSSYKTYTLSEQPFITDWFNKK